MILTIDPILNLLKLDESITWYGVIVRLVVATIFGGIVGLDKIAINQPALEHT